MGVEDRLKKDLEKFFIMKTKICKHSHRVRTLGQGLNGPEIGSWCFTFILGNLYKGSCQTK